LFLLFFANVFYRLQVSIILIVYIYVEILSDYLLHRYRKPLLTTCSISVSQKGDEMKNSSEFYAIYAIPSYFYCT